MFRRDFLSLESMVSPFLDSGSGSVDGDDGVGGPSALDPLGAESLAVGLPMGEAVCFLLVGITMANHDVLGNVASVRGQGTDMVKGGVVGAVGIAAGGLLHETPRVVIDVFLVPVDLVPDVDGSVF